MKFLVQAWQRARTPTAEAKPVEGPPEVLLLDTEFTQFRDGELLSLGVAVAAPHADAATLPDWLEAGGAFYAEVHDDALWRRASAFCQSTVLPQFGRLPGVRCGSAAEVGTRLADWLEQRGRPLVVGYDYKTDWRLLEAALVAARRWDRLKSRLMGLDVAEAVANEAARSALAQGLVRHAHGAMGQHHALVDALALRDAWNAVAPEQQAAWTARFVPSQDSEATRLARG